MPGFEGIPQNAPEKKEQTTADLVDAFDKALADHEESLKKKEEIKVEEKADEKKVEKVKEKKEQKKSGRAGKALKLGVFTAAAAGTVYVGNKVFNSDDKEAPQGEVRKEAKPDKKIEVEENKEDSAPKIEVENSKFFHMGPGFKQFLELNKSGPEDAPNYGDTKFEIPTTAPAASQPETQPATQPEVVVPPTVVEKTPEQVYKEKVASDLAKSRAKDREMQDKMDNLIRGGLPKPHQGPSLEGSYGSKHSTQPENRTEIKEKKQTKERLPAMAKWSQEMVEDAHMELAQVRTPGDAKVFVQAFFRDFERSYDNTRLKDVDADEAIAMGKYAEEMKDLLIGVCDKYGFEKDKKDIEKEFKQISNDTQMKSTYEYQKEKEMHKKLKKGYRR